MKTGDCRTFSVSIDQDVVGKFAALSGDYNPIHVDERTGGNSEFKGRIAHGALLLAYVSRMLGMELPGPRCVISRIDVRFPKALRPPEKIQVNAILQLYNAERSDGKVSVSIESAQGIHLEGHVIFTEYNQSQYDRSPSGIGDQRQTTVSSRSFSVKDRLERRKVLVTGGTGGLGRGVVESLAREYDCVVLTRRFYESSDHVSYKTLDVESSEELEKFLGAQDPAKFWGIVHMSAPSPVRRGIFDSISELRGHFYHAVDLPVRLGMWASGPGSGVRRLILMGSSAGSKNLEIAMAPYSLAKSCSSPLAQLMAAELARLGATVNVVAPGLIPAGMNAGIPQRRQVALAGMTPTGRLTLPGDIANLIDFLLSDESAQINGVTITVDGGYLR